MAEEKARKNCLKADVSGNGIAFLGSFVSHWLILKPNITCFRMGAFQSNISRVCIFDFVAITDCRQAVWRADSTVSSLHEPDGARVCGPQQLRQTYRGQNHRERLRVRGLLRLTEPRSGFGGQSANSSGKSLT